MMGEKTSFGYKDVSVEEKAGLVQAVFSSVASRYDLMNDLMSGGIHRLWKDSLVDQICPHENMTLLDVAGGTGDIAFRFCKKGGRSVTICDLSERMVCTGRDRAIDQGYPDMPLRWIVGNAENLPVSDASFDVYTIAFGLRNVTHITRALEEARRVLRPGGRFLCLEFSHVSMPVIKHLYDAYSFHILPHLGKIIAGDAQSYRYLAESIRCFPAREELVGMMEQAGLKHCKSRELSAGIVAIHQGWRI